MRIHKDDNVDRESVWVDSEMIESNSCDLAIVYHGAERK
jgi:hypothetical protein